MQLTGSMEAMAQLPSRIEDDPEGVNTVAAITGAHSGTPLSYGPSVPGVIPPGPQVISRTDVEVHCTDNDLAATFQHIRDRPELDEPTGHEITIPRNEITSARRDPSWSRRVDMSPLPIGIQEMEQQLNEGDPFGIDLGQVNARVAQIQRDIDDRARHEMARTPTKVLDLVPDSSLETTPSDEKSAQKPYRYRIGSEAGGHTYKEMPRTQGFVLKESPVERSLFPRIGKVAIICNTAAIR